MRGATYGKACEYVGITRPTLYTWMKKADEEGGIYAEFRDAVEKANSDLFMRLTEVLIDNAVEKADTRAAIALLDRRFPEEMPLKDKTVTHVHEGTIEHKLSAEQRIAEYINEMDAGVLDAFVAGLIESRARSIQGHGVEGSGKETLPSIYIDAVPDISGEPPQQSDSGCVGAGSGWDVQEADYRDATSHGEEF